ncbi:MAG: hypothetical protein QM636_21035 [Rhizobium sp.]
MTVEYISAWNASADERRSSTALVGSPQTIADSSPDHIGLSGKRQTGDACSRAG